MKEKGITLIALVITIIVLLILAGVAIASLTGNQNIIDRTTQAKTEHEEAQKNEISAISDYGAYIQTNGKEKNEKGFFYNVPYKTGWTNTEISVTFLSNNEIKIQTKRSGYSYSSGDQVDNVLDYYGSNIKANATDKLTINSLEFDKTYTGIDGFLGEDCSVVFNNDGEIIGDFKMSSNKVSVSDKKVTVTVGEKSFEVTFSSDGTAFSFEGSTFSI